MHASSYGQRSLDQHAWDRLGPRTSLAGSASNLTAVIPLYNKAEQVARAIRSVLEQRPPPDEVIVVDDGSIDGSDRVVAQFAPPVRVVRQKNSGEGAARNRGVRDATGDFVAFCDADDEWLPGFIATILRLKKRFPECDVLATSYVMREREGRDIVPVHAAVPNDEGVLEDYFLAASQSDAPFCSSSVAVRRTAFLAVGGFPENVRVGADFLCWARLANNCRIAVSRYPGAVFHLRGNYPSPPVRSPDVPDVVGRELSVMVSSTRDRPRRWFVSMWHRSRAIM